MKFVNMRMKMENKNQLEAERLRLFLKAFKMFPNSPKQNKVIKEIEKINKKLEKYFGN